jgi:hypothetical protein
MKQIEFTTAEREALQYWRFHHPHPRVQRKMEALYTYCISRRNLRSGIHLRAR